MTAELDPTRDHAHSASMPVSFDTLSAADALRDAGMEPGQARAVATQLRAAAGAVEAVTRPELEAALSRLRTELLERMGQLKSELLDRMAESERRNTASLWRLFGGIVAVAGLVVAAVKYLPS